MKVIKSLINKRAYKRVLSGKLLFNSDINRSIDYVLSTGASSLSDAYDLTLVNITEYDVKALSPFGVRLIEEIVWRMSSGAPITDLEGLLVKLVPIYSYPFVCSYHQFNGIGGSSSEIKDVFSFIFLNSQIINALTPSFLYKFITYKGKKMPMIAHLVNNITLVSKDVVDLLVLFGDDVHKVFDIIRYLSIKVDLDDLFHSYVDEHTFLYHVKLKHDLELVNRRTKDSDTLDITIRDSIHDILLNNDVSISLMIELGIAGILSFSDIKDIVAAKEE